MKRKNVLTRKKYNRGIELIKQSRFVEAIPFFQAICARDKKDFKSMGILGALYGKLGRDEEAIEVFSQSLALNKNDPEVWCNYGISLRNLEKYGAAANAFNKAIILKPDYREVYDPLAHALMRQSDMKGVAETYQKALEYYPESAEYHSNLATALYAEGKQSEAAKHYEEALILNDKVKGIYGGLGAIRVFQWRYEEALSYFRKGVEINPKDMITYESMLLCLNYIPDADREEIFFYHREWEKYYALPGRNTHWNNKINKEKNLKIGYVSPDFCEHSVSYFIKGILQYHDRSKVTIYCYSIVYHDDVVKQKLKSLSDEWRDVHDKNAIEIASIIKEDEIDILVDLAGHTAGNKLPLFTLKPAPVQISYLGYPNTTGLSTIDYRIVDNFTDPESEEKYYSETLYRLPGCFLCYMPPDNSPPVSSPPFSNNKYITFGSFNNLAKINESIIDAWVTILKNTPNSRLCLKNIAFSDISTREYYFDIFDKRGITRERLEFVGKLPDTTQHLMFYDKIDISLDTFPYNGTTTTCESLWMGVPVVTYAGTYHAGRVGASILNTLGLSEWASYSIDRYIDKAISFSNKPEVLTNIRKSLREKMQSSDLCNSKLFTHQLEGTYREIWVTQKV